MLDTVPAVRSETDPASAYHQLNTTHRELAEVLRAGGPFHQALRAAIAARGLSLEAIQRRLHANGHEVSIASLSHWQRGRSRPERASSLRTVGGLEKILGLSDGSLTGLLEPSQARGRWANHVPGSIPYAALGHSDRAIRMVSDSIDLDTNQRLETLSRHQDLYLDSEGRRYRMSVRTVLRARTDGADRMLIMNVGDDPCGVRPVFTPDASCRLGRTVYSPEDDMTAVELMFRRPLRTGETYLVEYQVAGANPRIRITELTVGLRQPTRECVLQVLFRPGSLPARCYPVWQPGTGRPARAAHTTEQHIESDGSTHVVLLDVPAGRYGLRWDWN